MTSQPAIIGSVTRPGAGRPETAALISKIPAPINAAVTAAHAASTTAAVTRQARWWRRGPARKRRCLADACLGSEHCKVFSEIDAWPQLGDGRLTRVDVADGRRVR